MWGSENNGLTRTRVVGLPERGRREQNPRPASPEARPVDPPTHAPTSERPSLRQAGTLNRCPEESKAHRPTFPSAPAGLRRLGPAVKLSTGAQEACGRSKGCGAGSRTRGRTEDAGLA